MADLQGSSRCQVLRRRADFRADRATAKHSSGLRRSLRRPRSISTIRNAVERNASNKPDDITVEQRVYRSKEWTEVPIFNVRRKDVTIAARYCLWLRSLRNSSGSLCQPDPPRLGGAGRGYGNRRHPRWWRIRGSLASRAGEVANKQNSFYDFIAAGGVLKKSGITSSDGLAIQGESNGSSRIAE
ncbi:prolyl oligopeptidase family serine peptidase (plasmid) [Rhizobium sp. BG4]|nr:prolyl oligopeptidase family serine peptidase [Rhizobium sp. BG4]